MKRILFTDPETSLFHELAALGIVDIYQESKPETHHLKGKKTFDISKEGYSQKFMFGNYDDLNLYLEGNKKYNEKYYDSENKRFKTATVELSDQAIEILKSSGKKGWKII